MAVDEMLVVYESGCLNCSYVLYFLKIVAMWGKLIEWKLRLSILDWANFATVDPSLTATSVHNRHFLTMTSIFTSGERSIHSHFS